MEKVTVDEIENTPRTSDVRKHLSDPLGLSDMVINYYELEPGDSFSGALHTHMEQEEVFYVVEGEAVFETEEGEIVVSDGEAIRFAPGEYQEGRNEGDDRIVALALGAPREAGETRVALDCRECGEADYYTVDVTDGGMTLTCPECGNEIEA